MQILSSWARRSAASPRRVMMVAVIVLAASVFLTQRLRVSMDISSLMPEHSRLSGTLLQVLNDFGSTDRLILAIEITGAGDKDPAANRRMVKELATRLAAGMEESGLFTSVAYRVTPSQQEFFEDLYFRHPFHYHSPASRQDLKNKLAPAEVARRVSELGRKIRLSPFGASAQRQLLRDPLGLQSDNPSAYGQDKVTGFRLDVSDSYFFTGDGRLLLMIAKPRSPSQDTVFDAELLAGLERLLDELGGSGNFRSDYSMPIGSQFVVQLLGPHVETLYGTEAAQKEILPSIVVTCLGLLILFVAVYRNLTMVFILALPLLLGILVTSGIVAIFTGYLTMITVGFAAMLAGLGIDFEVHVVERIGQESNPGGDLKEAIARAFETTGRGVVAGALTTAAIFLLIATSDFAALHEFGWIIGLGILLTMAAMFFLLPALVVSFPTSFRSHGRGLGISWSTWIVKHYRSVCVLGGLLTLALGYSASNLELESNIYKLGPMNPGYEQEKDRILSKAGGSTNVVMIVAEREDLQDLLELSEQINALLEGLQASGEIDSFESLSSIVPSHKSQHEILQVVSSWDLDASMAAFKTSLGEAGFRVAQFDPFVRNVLDYQSESGAYIEPEDFEGTPAEDLVDRLLVRTERGWRAVSYLYPRSGHWENDVPAAIVEAFEGLGEGIVITGIVPIFNEIAHAVRQEFIGLTLSALIAVWFISMLFFRKPLLSLMSLVPALVGLVWTLGLMKLAGIELNLITTLVAPMIVGLGIDDALHILHRHEEKSGSIPETMGAVSGAILMTSATTVIGFGSLALADLPSLRSLGIAVSIGMVCCAVSSLLLLPALLTALDARK